MIRLATTADAAAIATIYNHYVRSSTITFEEQIVGIDEMAQRIASVGGQLPWYVFERNSEIVGYAYATPWRARSAYRFSVESTVYVAHECVGQGIGRQLYIALIDDLRKRQLQVVRASLRIWPATVRAKLRRNFDASSSPRLPATR